MILPALTPQMVRDRMTTAWATANSLYQKNAFIGSRYFMNEYDYLSNWQNG